MEYLNKSRIIFTNRDSWPRSQSLLWVIHKWLPTDINIYVAALVYTGSGDQLHTCRECPALPLPPWAVLWGRSHTGGCSECFAGSPPLYCTLHTAMPLQDQSDPSGRPEWTQEELRNGGKENKMVTAVEFWHDIYNHSLSSANAIAGAENEKNCLSESEFHHWPTKTFYLEPWLPGFSLVSMPFVIPGHSIALKASWLHSEMEPDLWLTTRPCSCRKQRWSSMLNNTPHSLPQGPHDLNIIITIGSSPVHLGLSLPSMNNLPAKTFLSPISSTRLVQHLWTWYTGAMEVSLISLPSNEAGWSRNEVSWRAGSKSMSCAKEPTIIEFPTKLCH